MNGAIILGLNIIIKGGRIMDESLYEAVSDFLESCHRTGNHDVEDNFRTFLVENHHMNLNEEEVHKTFLLIDSDY